MQKLKQIFANIRYRLIPLIIIGGILPFISKMYGFYMGMSEYRWAPEADIGVDVFLFGKMCVLGVLAAIMTIVLLVSFITKKIKLNAPNEFIPLGIYFLFVLISAIFAINVEYAFMGSYTSFDSVITIFGYVMTVIYAYYMVRDERDVRAVIISIGVSTAIQSVFIILEHYGIEYLGNRFIATLITSKDYMENTSGIGYVKGVLTGTLFNSNYIGVYYSMTTILALFITVYTKKLSTKIIAGVFSVISLVTLYLSRSSGGIIACACAFVLMLVFSWQAIRKYCKIVIPAAVIVLAAGIAVDAAGGWSLTKRVTGFFTTDYSFTAVPREVVTAEDGVHLIYEDEELVVSVEKEKKNVYKVNVQDTEGKKIQLAEDENNICTFTDEKYGEVSFKTVEENYRVWLEIYFGERKMKFIAEEGENYLYYNNYGRLIGIKTAKNAMPSLEYLFSSRGYIWGRTIPLLKDYIFIGAGPDNYILVFPHDDYYIAPYIFGDSIVTRPHNLYLGIFVNTGGVSLICFLAMCLMYGISCVKLYFKCGFKKEIEVMGFGVCLAVVAYLIAGLVNDSLIVSASTFWLLVGIGIAINTCVKRKAQADEVNVSEAEEVSAAEAIMENEVE